MHNILNKYDRLFFILKFLLAFLLGFFGTRIIASFIIDFEVLKVTTYDYVFAATSFVLLSLYHYAIYKNRKLFGRTLK